MIRVVVADDHEVVRVGLCSLLALAQDVELVGEASTGEETVAMVVAAVPDVLLLDVQMPRGDGMFVLEELARRDVTTATLVLTTFDGDDLALQAIARGAKGFLLKNVKLPQLLSAVRELAQGGTVLSPGISEEARKTLRDAAPPNTSEPVTDELTVREREILRLMSGGYSNREIGKALHVAEGTVKNHVSNILSKLGVRDRTRAVLKAAERGYLE